MKRKIINIIMSLGVFAAFVAVPAVATTSVYATSGVDKAKGGVTSVNDGNATNLPAFIKSIINILLFILGVIAVLMIIIGGIRFVTSGGDSNAVSSARNTILYSVIGLVVALMAFAIVNFVLNAL